LITSVSEPVIRSLYCWLMLDTGWWYWMPAASASLIRRQNCSATQTQDSMRWQRMLGL